MNSAKCGYQYYDPISGASAQDQSPEGVGMGVASDGVEDVEVACDGHHHQRRQREHVHAERDAAGGNWGLLSGLRGQTYLPIRHSYFSMICRSHQIPSLQTKSRESESANGHTTVRRNKAVTATTIT